MRNDLRCPLVMLDKNDEIVAVEPTVGFSHAPHAPIQEAIEGYIIQNYRVEAEENPDLFDTFTL